MLGRTRSPPVWCPRRTALLGLLSGLAGCGVGEIGGVESTDRGDGGNADVTEIDRGPFVFATVGRRCGSGPEQAYIVLSDARVSCVEHGARLDAPDGRPLIVAPVPGAPGPVEVMATVCLDYGGPCAPRLVSFTFDGWASGVGAVGRWRLTGPDGEPRGGAFDAGWCDYDLPGTESLARDLAVDAVKILQGTTVSLYEDGALVADRNAPVVAGRPARLRVFLRPLPGYEPQTIIARLTLVRAGRDPVVLEARDYIDGPSDESALDTTLNFELLSSYLESSLEWKVELYGASACDPAGDPRAARAPADGRLAAMSPESMGTSFNVVLVPVRYNADGSGRLPDTSSFQLERFRNTMYAQYPIADLNLSVRTEPLDFDEVISRTDSRTWSPLLEAVLSLKATDDPPDNTFYYGLVTPVASFNEFCEGGCVAGIGPIPEADSVFGRGAIGLGYGRQGVAETFTHEIGHATGRRHAPCGASSIDDSFPYADGGIGPWGYNLVTGSLLSPARYSDIMGYCDPPWISDYNYAAIFERIRRINNASPLTAWPTRRVRVAVSGAGRPPRWGRTVSVAEALSDPVSVQLEDATGAVVAIDTADRLTLDHGAGAMYLVPMSVHPDAVRVRLPDGQALPLETR